MIFLYFISPQGSKIKTLFLIPGSATKTDFKIKTLSIITTRIFYKSKRYQPNSYCSCSYFAGSSLMFDFSLSFSFLLFPFRLSPLEIALILYRIHQYGKPANRLFPVGFGWLNINVPTYYFYNPF